jgi:hypothetical protein
VNPADAHALTMVAILAFAMGSLVTMFFIMVRNGKRRNEELDLPPAEETESPTQRPASKREAKREAWEKDGDWWKD